MRGRRVWADNTSAFHHTFDLLVEFVRSVTTRMRPAGLCSKNAVIYGKHAVPRSRGSAVGKSAELNRVGINSILSTYDFVALVAFNNCNGHATTPCRVWAIETFARMPTFWRRLPCECLPVQSRTPWTNPFVVRSAPSVATLPRAPVAQFTIFRQDKTGC